MMIDPTPVDCAAARFFKPDHGMWALVPTDADQVWALVEAEDAGLRRGAPTNPRFFLGNNAFADPGGPVIAFDVDTEGTREGMRLQVGWAWKDDSATVMWNEEAGAWILAGLGTKPLRVGGAQDTEGAALINAMRSHAEAPTAA